MYAAAERLPTCHASHWQEAIYLVLEQAENKVQRLIISHLPTTHVKNFCYFQAYGLRLIVKCPTSAVEE